MQASMRIDFKLDLAPLDGVKKMCESAGLKLTAGPTKKGGANVRVWKTDGPAATCRFASTQKAHARGWGRAACREHKPWNHFLLVAALDCHKIGLSCLQVATIFVFEVGLLEPGAV